jgi:[ribosomal protein S5]-alanine N-acetyltransferase
MTDLFTLETERLRLIPLDLEHLLLLKESRNLLEQRLGLQPSRMEFEATIQVEINEALDFWISQVRQHPHTFAWYTNWEIILKSMNQSIGGIGLANISHAPEQVLVGYGLDLKFRSRGYLSESLGALVKWVFSHPEKERMIAETPRDNIASQKVLRKNGFTKVKEREATFLWELHRSDLLPGNQHLIANV